MFIYLITNKITGRSYVGQTKRSIDCRLKSHIQEAKSNKYSTYLHNSIRKHGEENFFIELIEECGTEEVYERETFWIKHLNTKEPFGYNEHEGGKGGCLNPSEQLRKKLSDAKKGKPTWNAGISKDILRKRREGLLCIFCDKPKPKSEKKVKPKKERKKRKKAYRRVYKCGICNVIFFSKKKNRTVCSVKCAGMYSAMKQKQGLVTGGFKKGQTAWNKGLPNPQAAINGKNSAKKVSMTITGRKKKYREDGSWYWYYPEKNGGEKSPP